MAIHHPWVRRTLGAASARDCFACERIQLTFPLTILENYVEFPTSEFGVMIRKMPLALRIGVDPFRKYECVAGVNADSLECFSDYFICLSQLS